MIVSMDVETCFYKIEDLFIIKALNKHIKGRHYVNITRAIDDRPSANSLLIGESLEASPLRSEQGKAAHCHHFHLSQA